MDVLLLFLLFELGEVNSEDYDSRNYGKRKVINDAVAPDNYKILPETYERPVDFQHITKHGFGDIEYKEPFDLLQYAYYNTKKTGRARTLQDSDRKEQFKNLDNANFPSPRDEMLYNKKLYDDNNKKDVIKPAGVKAQPRDDSAIIRNYDFTEILETNLAYPISRQRPQSTRVKNTTRPHTGSIEQTRTVEERFQNNTFGLRLEPEQFIFKTPRPNWTTCDEFARGALFHPNDIVNTDWIPFYTWTTKRTSTAFVHKFSFPTQKLVQRFKRTYGPYTQKLNWNQPKLFLREFEDLLLIAGDRKGLFYGIIDRELPDFVKRSSNYTLALIPLRMKILDPYLALMNCDLPLAKIMSELGTEPVTSKDKRLEAESLRFRGLGNPVYRDIAREEAVKSFKARMNAEAESKKYIQVGSSLADAAVPRGRK